MHVMFEVSVRVLLSPKYTKMVEELLTILTSEVEEISGPSYLRLVPQSRHALVLQHGLISSGCSSVLVSLLLLYQSPREQYSSRRSVTLLFLLEVGIATPTGPQPPSPFQAPTLIIPPSMPHNLCRVRRESQ